MKQDAMNDKIKERCKTCEKQFMQEGLDRSKSCRDVIKRKPRNLDGSRIYQESIRHVRWSEQLLNGLRSCREFIEKKPRNLDGSRFRQDQLIKRRKKGSIEENLLRICQEAVELEEMCFQKGEKTHKHECNK